jgi:hypothetical protein
MFAAAALLASKFRIVESCQAAPLAGLMPRAQRRRNCAGCLGTSRLHLPQDRQDVRRETAKASAGARFAAAPFVCATPRLVWLPSIVPCAYFTNSAAPDALERVTRLPVLDVLNLRVAPD